MPITAKLDEFGKPAWIALVVLGFMAWWPLGLATIAFMVGSGRMGCGRNGEGWSQKMDRWGSKMERMGGCGGRGPGGWGRESSSGNRAFDEYRVETLRRLEDEQREFRDFLERLRMAKDKSEFDQFMAERRNRPASETPQAQS